MRNNRPLRFNKIRTILFLVFILGLLWINTLGAGESPYSVQEALISTNTNPNYNQSNVIDTTHFIEKEVFTESLKRSTPYSLEGDILAGILPHHNVAAPIMGDFYNHLSQVTSPDVIILLGPNHKGEGDQFQSGDFLFNTYSGIVNEDQDIMTDLYKKEAISTASLDYFSIEHSLNIHMNYIAYYFKGVKVVPIIINEARNDKGLEEMAEALASACSGKKYLIICSVDFSHYLTLAEANEKDELTQTLLLSKDQDQLVHLDNDYVDCPSTIVLMLKLLALQGDSTCHIMEHSNSETIIGKKNLEETTSYFSVLYTRGTN